MFPFGGGGVRGVRLTRSHKGDWLHVPTYCLELIQIHSLPLCDT